MKKGEEVDGNDGMDCFGEDLEEDVEKGQGTNCDACPATELDDL